VRCRGAIANGGIASYERGVTAGMSKLCQCGGNKIRRQCNAGFLDQCPSLVGTESSVIVLIAAQLTGENPPHSREAIIVWGGTPA